MKVQVNRTVVDIFDGARSQHAVLRYLVQRRRPRTLLKQGRIQDAYGHDIGLDAPLHEGQIIKFKV
ncbi:MAG: hypothetical protein IKN60_06825 [Bacteroidales bacterium]|nr:hypothetical protein [Bacteroidales bacterium]MBR6875424.1 hypothetical protein [Bacteroidales bacterium]